MYQRVDIKLAGGAPENYYEYMRLRKWCAAQFGASKVTPDAGRPWHAKREYYLQLVWPVERLVGVFYFRDRAHATMFALKWS